MSTPSPPKPPALPDAGSTQRFKAAMRESAPALGQEIARHLPSPHWSHHVMDRLSGIAGSVCILAMVLRDKLGGVEGAIFVVSLLGGMEALRRVGVRFGGTAGGAMALAFAILSSTPMAWPASILAGALTLLGLARG